MAQQQPSRPDPATEASDRAGWQDQLDRLDREILTAINARAQIAKQIAELTSGEAVDDPRRAADLLKRLEADNPGPLGDAAVAAVFRELISGSRAAHAPLRVAYLGPEYTFSHLAAIHRFGQSAELIPVGTIASVFEEVTGGQADFGVVPLENSTDGRVTDTLECFSRTSARICGELPMRIRHCLLGIGRRDQIETVYSKPQALSQCRNWLASHLPQATTHPVASTAEAAAMSAADCRAGAIASAEAGVNHHLQALARNIEDNPENITRFAVIGRSPAEVSGDDKTALMFEIPHEPGALADTMAIFQQNELNMTWIESFPIPGSRGRYLFLVEFVGHQEEPGSRRAIEALRKKAVLLEVLGSYAQVDPIG